MRIAIMGPSGSGKTWLATQLANVLGIHHIELDALHHGPNWKSCGADVLRERVDSATQGDTWIADGTYHLMIGELVLERADTVVWLDLPVPVVMYRLLRRTHLRRKHEIELWHGDREGPWRESFGYLIRPAFERAFENRRALPPLLARHPHLQVQRLCSDRAVRRFIGSIGQTTSAACGERGDAPPLADTGT